MCEKGLSMNKLTTEQRLLGLVNIRKLRIDLAKISERKHYQKNNSLEKMKIKAGQLESMTQEEYDLRFKPVAFDDLVKHCEKHNCGHKYGISC